MRFLKIYRQVKDVFVKPKLKWYFGTWKNEPNLPIWRRGACINLAKRISWVPNEGKAYYPKNSIYVFEGYSGEYNGKPIKKYGLSTHKLPGKLNQYTPVWNRNIRKKLRKWHLSWIPPMITLPLWTAFRFDDSDIMWKTKYDDFRYEFPAHITLVIFGLAISVTAVPSIGDYTSYDDYWESILNYRYYKSLKKTHEIMGVWNHIGTDKKTIRFNPDFLKEPYKTELKKIQNEIQN